MPHAAPRICCKPACGRTTHGRYCEQHTIAAQEETKRYDQERGSAAQRGYGHKWRQYCKRFLSKAENALCVVSGCNQPSTVVDHVVPHRGDKSLFWMSANHQGMCKHHHDSKTAREDGGFGRKISKQGVGGQMSGPSVF